MIRETRRLKSGYTVQVNLPAKLPESWFYWSGYFPRTFHYKANAEECARQAIERGALSARVECPDGAELDFRPQPCGHSLDQIASGAEGTNYCLQCDAEANPFHEAKHG